MKVTKMKTVDKNLPIKDRIAFLKHCADLYETNGTSPISDAVYDIEYYELEAIDPDNPFFEEVGGLTDQHIYGTLVQHDVTMGSLSKCPDISKFNEWITKAYKKPRSYILQHKIDGLSLSLIYDNGKLVRATTRGDGTDGIDVTKNALYVKGVLNKIPCKDRVEVRGECFKDRQDFYKKWHVSVMKNGYKNPRNFSSGSLNQKDAKVTKERGLAFLAYEAVQMDFDTEVEKNRFLVRMGFDTLKDSTRRTKDGLTFDQIVKAVTRYMDDIDRDKLPYDIDGVVVKLNDINDAQAMGYTAGGRKPKANRAVKFPPEEKDTIVIGVIKAVGRTGALTPVATLKPVELGGAMMTKATLHNYGALVGMNAIKIGAVVTIAKKGDIIPQIVKVKTNGTKDIDIPDSCPSCGEGISWDTNKVHLVCTNMQCPAQLGKKIDHWCKKIGVKGIGMGTLSKLTDPDILSWEDEAIISSLPEMYYMLNNDRKSEHPFRKYARLKEFFGDKTYKKMIDSMSKVTEMTLAKFIEALGIGKVGSTAVDLVAIAPTIDDIDKLTVADIDAIDGFADIKAQGFYEGWKAMRPEIKLLLKYVKIVADKKSSDKLKGQSFCFTGSFDAPKRRDMEAMVPDHCGKVSSVSKNLTALVWDGEIDGGKVKKAKTLNIPIISQGDFLKMIKD